MPRTLRIISLALPGLLLLTAWQGPIQVTTSERPLYPDYHQAVTLRRTDTFGSLEPLDGRDVWGLLVDMQPGPSNGVLVTDMRMQRVDLVVPGKGVVRTFGNGEGSGPGEFREPAGCSWDGKDLVVVTDRRLVRASVFRTDGTYVREVQLPVRPTSVLAQPGGTLWVRPEYDATLDRLVCVDIQTGKTLREIGSRYNREKWWRRVRMDAGYTPTAEGMLMSLPYPYAVAEYTGDGTLRSAFGRPVTWLTPPVKTRLPTGGELWSYNNGQVGAAVRFPNGNTAVQISQRHRYPGGAADELRGFNTYSLDLFDEAHRWLAEVPMEDLIPEATNYSFQMAAARDGALWIAFNPEYPQVARFALEWR